MSSCTMHMAPWWNDIHWIDHCFARLHTFCTVNYPQRLLRRFTKKWLRSVKTAIAILVSGAINRCTPNPSHSLVKMSQWNNVREHYYLFLEKKIVVSANCCSHFMCLGEEKNLGYALLHECFNLLRPPNSRQSIINSPCLLKLSQ